MVWFLPTSDYPLNLEESSVCYKWETNYEAIDRYAKFVFNSLRMEFPWKGLHKAWEGNIGSKFQNSGNDQLLILPKSRFTVELDFEKEVPHTTALSAILRL